MFKNAGAIFMKLTVMADHPHHMEKKIKQNKINSFVGMITNLLASGHLVLTCGIHHLNLQCQKILKNFIYCLSTGIKICRSLLFSAVLFF
jgi:hypothetical protein